jgi:hypothetical protein
MHATEGRAHCAGAPRATKGTRPRVRQRGRLCARGPRFRVEQDGPRHRARLVLGDDDAAVAGEFEIDLGQRAIVCGARREGGAVERVGLAVGVVEGARFGIEQVSRVRLFRGRVQRRGRRRVHASTLPPAEELAEHVCYWHAAMERALLAGNEEAVAVFRAGAETWTAHGSARPGSERCEDVRGFSPRRAEASDHVVECGAAVRGGQAAVVSSSQDASCGRARVAVG